MRCFDSSFLGHATAVDLLNAFKHITSSLDLRKILQISMDGPNVNLKFLRDLKAELKERDSDGPVPLNLGTCGLHQLHNSYKKAMKETGWNLVKFLRALYFIFSRIAPRDGKITQNILALPFFL